MTVVCYVPIKIHMKAICGNEFANGFDMSKAIIKIGECVWWKQIKLVYFSDIPVQNGYHDKENHWVHWICSKQSLLKTCGNCQEGLSHNIKALSYREI